MPGVQLIRPTRHGIQIACLEEIAFERGLITADQRRARGELFDRTAYGRAILPALSAYVRVNHRLSGISAYRPRTGYSIASCFQE